MNKFNVGDMIRRTSFSIGDVQKGCVYEVVSTNGTWVTVQNDNSYDQQGLQRNYELVVTNELQVGETYMSNNGSSWVAIYEEDDLVWMKSSDGGAAYVFTRDGTTVSLAGSSNKYNINWEVTKGPIIEEGVYVTGGYHLGLTGNGSYDNILVHNLTVTTVDGVPDWTTLACKE